MRRRFASGETSVLKARPTVVLEPPDRAALTILGARHVRALAHRHPTVRLRATFHAMDVTLPGAEPERFAAGETAAVNALPDADVLTRLTAIDAGRAGERSGRHQ